jgi:hypothetical protein
VFAESSPQSDHFVFALLFRLLRACSVLLLGVVIFIPVIELFTPDSPFSLPLAIRESDLYGALPSWNRGILSQFLKIATIPENGGLTLSSEWWWPPFYFVFIILATWPIWLVTAGLRAWFYLRYVQGWRGPDLTGILGNGRLFFSGLKGSLSKIDQAGKPDIFVPGLACPPKAGREAVLHSALVASLKKYGAVNETNLELVAIILADPSMPAFLPSKGEEESFMKKVGSLAIAQTVTFALEQAFSILRSEEVNFSRADIPGGIIGEREYGALLRRSLERVISADQIEYLRSSRPHMVATVILSAFAGRALRFSKHGAGWSISTPFPELAARSVLHSVAAFGSDYSGEERDTIRRSVLYANRYSLLGSVRFPVDISEEVRVLRQWSELLHVSPHELQTAADEVELFGLLESAHASFWEAFQNGILSHDEGILRDSFADDTGLLFVHLGALISLFRQKNEPKLIRRIDELVSVIYQKQRIQLTAVEVGGDPRPPLPLFQRIEPSLSLAEIRTLSAVHDLKVEELQTWGALRAVLTSHGWVARRVGDTAVPKENFGFLVARTTHQAHGKNALDLIGRLGMVALRGGRLEERFGELWHNRFLPVTRVAMTDTKERFDRFLQGVFQTVDDDNDEG